MMKKKILSLAVLLAMLLQMFAPVNFAVAVDNEVPSNQINVTKSKLTITDNSDVVIAPTQDAGGNWVYNNIPKDAKINIEYAFSLLDNNGLDSSDPSFMEYNYTSGQAISVNMPAGVDFSSTVPALGQPVLASDNSRMGTLKMVGNAAVISFEGYDYVDTHSSMGGAFHIRGSFDSSIKANPNPDPITFVFNGTTYKINVKKDPTPPPPPSFKVNISKNGVYDSATNTITWTVTLKPTEGDAKDISIEDVYSPNQQYTDKSFTVDGAAVPSGLTHDAANHKLTYVFSADIPENTEKIITYKTSPLSNAFDSENGTVETVDFINTATVKSGSADKGTVQAKIQFNWIQKNGVFDTNTLLVHWTVDINSDCNVTDSEGKTTSVSQSVKNPVITDVLPAGLDLVANSVKFDNVDVLSYNYDNTTKTLVYSHNGTITGKKTLTYDTRVANPDADLNKNEKTNYTNTAKLEWTGNTGGTPTCKADVGVGKSVIAKSGTGKPAFVASGKDDEITWTITVNENMITMLNPTVTDDLPAGLEYVPGSFRLDDYRKGDVEFFGTLSDDDPTSISYAFGKDINDTHVIKFITKVKDYGKFYANSTAVTFTNTATVTSPSLKDGKQSATASKSFTSEVISKSVATAYDYTTRRVKWKIALNRNKIPMTSAVISDTIPEGMKFIAGTFDVVNESNAHVTSSAGVLEYVNAGDDVTSSKDSFKYTFSSTNDTKKYTITYETEMKEKYLKENQFAAPKDFINTADISASNYTGTISSSANQQIKNPIIEKKSSYLKGADTIDWIVPINISKTGWPEGIEISDDLQQELELEADTVKLYHMDLKFDGTLTKSIPEKPVPKTEYDVEYKGKKLTISIHGPVTGAYQLEFTTDVLSEQANISNSITFKGSAISAGSNSSSVYVNVNDAGSSFYGKQGKVTICKVDEADNNVKLSGAVFQLYDINKIPIIGKMGTTDANGKLVFDSLKLRTYYIGEISAPEGYLADKTLQRVKLDPNTLDLNATFTNKKGVAEIEFQKQNSAGKPLAGAEFALYSKGSTVSLKTAISDNNGKVAFTGVAVGDYEIKESKAPEGYNLSTETIEAKVEIVNGEANAKATLSKNVIKNIPKDNPPPKDNFSDIEFQKQTSAGKPLAGAEFTLYSKGKTVPLKTAVSDNNGKVVFTGVAVGEYQIKESKAPEGYNLSTETIEAKVEIVNGEANAKVTLSKNVIKNTPKDNPPPKDTPQKEPTPPGRIVVTKTDESGKPLAGAQITLYSSDGISIKTGFTGTDGKLSFEGLYLGGYTVKETKAPEGYELNSTAYPLSVQQGSNAVTIIDKAKKEPGTITVIKKDESGAVLEGAGFTLADSSGTIIATGITDKNGYLLFSNLSAGNYTITEINAPKGYKLDSTAIKVTLESGKGKEVTVMNKKQNPIEEGSIIIRKTDGEAKQLSGAEFSLVDANGKTIASGTTDKSGTLKLDNIPVGSYTIKETKAPNGYELDTASVKITVDSKQTKEVVVTNKKQINDDEKGSVIIKKTDGKAKQLSGAEFSLVDANGKTIASGATDKNGTLMLDNIPVGSYTIKETVAPNGYELNAVPVKITVESKQTKEIVVTNKKKMPDEKGDITLNKIDGKSNPLPGAEFTLYDAHGKILAKYVSDENGCVKIEKLKEGDYGLQETKAPAGYTLVSDRLKIKIEKDKLLELTFRDIRIEEVEDNKIPLGWIDIIVKPKPDPDIHHGKIPQAGEWADTFVMLVAGAGLVGVGGIWLAVSKRRKKTD